MNYFRHENACLWARCGVEHKQLTNKIEALELVAVVVGPAAVVVQLESVQAEQSEQSFELVAVVKTGLVRLLAVAMSAEVTEMGMSVSSTAHTPFQLLAM